MVGAAGAHVAVIFPDGDCSSVGTVGPSGEANSLLTWMDGCSLGSTSHELGHNMELNHAGTDIANTINANTIIEYGDGSDIMGGADGATFNAPHVGQMGWFAKYPNSIRYLQHDSVGKFDDEYTIQLAKLSVEPDDARLTAGAVSMVSFARNPEGCVEQGCHTACTDEGWSRPWCYVDDQEDDWKACTCGIEHYYISYKPSRDNAGFTDSEVGSSAFKDQVQVHYTKENPMQHWGVGESCSETAYIGAATLEKNFATPLSSTGVYFEVIWNDKADYHTSTDVPLEVSVTVKFTPPPPPPPPCNVEDVGTGGCVRECDSVTVSAIQAAEMSITHMGLDGWAPVGEVTTDSSDLEAFDDGGEQMFGVQFATFPVAKGAQIESARINFVYDGDYGNDPLSSTIYAEDGTTPGLFTEDDNDLLSSSRPSTESLAGGAITWTMDASQPATTADIKSIVQHLVSRTDWTRLDNRPTFMFKRKSGSGKRKFDSSPHLITLEADVCSYVDYGGGVNACSGSPCKNAGACSVNEEATGSPFDCDCAGTGFYGDTCETTDASDEGNGPNGSFCKAGVTVDVVKGDGSFTCDCTDTIFKGDNCEIYLDFGAEANALCESGFKLGYPDVTEYKFRDENGDRVKLTAAACKARVDAEVPNWTAWSVNNEYLAADSSGGSCYYYNASFNHWTFENYDDLYDGNFFVFCARHGLSAPHPTCTTKDKNSDSLHRCVFPFQEKGILYNGCAPYGTDTWCATTADYDADGERGVCETTAGAACPYDTLNTTPASTASPVVNLDWPPPAPPTQSPAQAAANPTHSPGTFAQTTSEASVAAGATSVALTAAFTVGSMSAVSAGNTITLTDGNGNTFTSTVVSVFNGVVTFADQVPSGFAFGVTIEFTAATVRSFTKKPMVGKTTFWPPPPSATTPSPPQTSTAQPTTQPLFKAKPPTPSSGVAAGGTLPTHGCGLNQCMCTATNGAGSKTCGDHLDGACDADECWSRADCPGKGYVCEAEHTTDAPGDDNMPAGSEVRGKAMKSTKTGKDGKGTKEGKGKEGKGKEGKGNEGKGKKGKKGPRVAALRKLSEDRHVQKRTLTKYSLLVGTIAVAVAMAGVVFLVVGKRLKHLLARHNTKLQPALEEEPLVLLSPKRARSVATVVNAVTSTDAASPEISTV